MGGYGKHPHDSGRARYHRFRDRAQLAFDDMLIGDFLESDDDADDAALARIPVRYGVSRLADPSDSAIAAAMLDAGVFAGDEGDDILAVQAPLGENLFELVGHERSAAPARPAAAPPPAPVIRTRRPAPAEPESRLSLLGFVEGFLIGAACAAAAVGLFLLVL